jgi:hypothetical protein
MKTRYLFAATAALLIGSSAFAGTECTIAPQGTWMTQEQMLQKLVDTGYTIERFLVTKGNCYEMYGWDKDGRRVEIYHNPVDGKVVKAKTSAPTSTSTSTTAM